MKRPDGLLKAGLIINIILTSIGYISTLASWGLINYMVEHWQGSAQEKAYLMSLVGAYHALLVVFGLILPTIGLILTIKAFKEPRFKIAAGVIALLCNLISGIFILVGKYEDMPHNNYYNQNYQNDQYNNLK